MKILVDTCVWSLALRRNETAEHALVEELTELVAELRVQLIGPVRQELLSGVKTKKQFSSLKKYLAAFHDLPLDSADFELAAEFFNLARSKGIQGSNTDYLICAVAHRHQLPIFTTDQDFERYSSVVPIRLYQPRLR
ncbi:MAG: twitching motility protein PilT [Deltaproteobacteria bacterium RIFOXYD12_FULL_56_24]|nr:MAG: twitching motility protein PilT [Deltaproteobacteria bacterium RIFOXYD12_FULL_56_24]